MRLLLKSDEGYEEARVGRIFNQRRPERYPAAVLLARDEDDVVAGVRLANDKGWPVSVRSGGHSWAAWSLRDDALLIDLGQLNEVAYDEGTGIATAGPAVQGGRTLAPFLASHGRAFPGGHCPGVGLGGYLLQGGQGWNGRVNGWACESVLAVDVVTAAGTRVRADADQNPDLYWAARGAGPGFPGVVTRFHLRTFPAAAQLWHDTWTFRLDDAEALLAWLHDLLPTLDRRVEPVLAATRLPGDGHTVLLLHTTAMVASADEAAALFRTFDAAPVPALGHVRAETTLAEENAAQALQNPEGHRYCADSQWTNAGAAELAPLLRDVWSELPTRHSFSIWYGWAPTRPLPDMAFSLEANVYLATYAIWTEPEDDERHRSWVHGHHARLAEQVGEGVYVGDSDFTRRPDRFLLEDNAQRLAAIRAQRDPDGVFG